MPVKVLIADDAVFMRNAIKDVFDKAGFEVVGEAGNGVEALEKFREKSADLVTMDIVMPFRSGIEATRMIREMDKNVTIVICSALGQESLVMEALDAGADDFVVKPFRGDVFLKVVEKVLHRKKDELVHGPELIQGLEGPSSMQAPVTESTRT
jgi:two-component system, chemotaxis family, chemotaxis protein CheY